MTNLYSLAQYVLSKDSRCGGELKELNGLNQLRENLSIKNLRHKKDAELEYKAVNLKEKQLLNGLALEWIEREVDVGYDEMSVEALEPNQNVQARIKWLQGSEISKLAFFTQKSCKPYVTFNDK